MRAFTTQSLSEFAESYVVPMEYANRTDVRWMQLADQQHSRPVGGGR